MRELLVRGLCRGRNGDVPIFTRVSLELTAGQWCWITGPSGSGKSTLLRSIAGLEPLVEGELVLDGQTPDEMGWTCFRRRVLYQRQDPPRFACTIAQFMDDLLRLRINAERPLPKNYSERVRDNARRLLLPADISAREFRNLSGGEMLRVVLALNLALEPDIIMLDEPLAALDNRSRDAAIELAGEWLAAGERAALCVAHDLPSAPLGKGERVMVMDKGGLVEVGREAEGNLPGQSGGESSWRA